MYSNEHKKFLKRIKLNKIFITTIQILIIVLLIIIWEILARKNIINTFLSSSPSTILKTIINLFKNNNLISHINITFLEVLISFLLSTTIGILIATIMWWNKTLSKIIDPYLTVLNSLPKVSLGPLIIIWSGANIKSIILMAILISLFTTIINMYTSFIETDQNKITLLKSFNASKLQIFKLVVFRSNIKNLISTLKINISLSLIGVIMGELLVSKKGLGYLITYGSQTFNLNLVITSIVILGIMSYFLYIIIDRIEKKITSL